jgi:polysaccharide export outer membrane protein
LQASKSEAAEVFKSEASNTEKQYVIQKNDQLRLQINLYNGEHLVAPTPQTQTEGSTPSNTSSNDQGTGTQFKYEVDNRGIVKFPMIGEIKLEGLTLREAEEIARKEYLKFFKEPYVQLSYVNKRVVLLGSPGGQVIPLNNSNMRLPEVLALARGIGNDGWANKVKLIRNDHVYQFNLTTIPGFKEANILVEPGDIIYVEPVRRPFTEGIKDNYIIASLFFTIISLAALIRASK